MAGEPLVNCVTCWERLTLAELAHSPCKHCHVEFCTNCLKRAFKIAERDDVLEVSCPNPHCKKPLNAECMKPNPQAIRAWVEKELTERRYGVLDRYKDQNVDDIVNLITNHRNVDLGHLRRTSSIWEEQILSLKLQPKADLNDIPLAPTLLHNQSQERIELRSKFSPQNLQRSQRSLSLPSKHDIKRIQLFKMQYDDDTTDEDSDGEYIHQHHTDNTVNAATSKSTRKHRKAGTLLDQIIDEDAELNDPHFRSPLASTLNNEFPFDHLEQLPDSLPSSLPLSSKDSPLSLFSDLSLQSPPLQSTRNSHSNAPESALSKSASSARRLSASFKSLFKSKSAQSTQNTPKSASSNDMHNIENNQAGKPNVRRHSKRKRKRNSIRDRARALDTESDDELTAESKHVHRGSSRLFDKLTFKKKNKSAAETDERHNNNTMSPQSETHSDVDQTPKNRHAFMKVMSMSKSAEPPSKSTLDFPSKIGVSPPPANTNSLSYQKQIAHLNEQKRKRKEHELAEYSNRSNSKATDDDEAPARRLDLASTESQSLPVPARIRPASKFKYPAVATLTVNVDSHHAANGDQLKPPTYTPSLPKSSPGSSPAHTPLSELSAERVSERLTVDTAMTNLQHAVNISNSASNNNRTPSKLSLAPINSTQEQDELELAEFKSNVTAIHEDISQHSSMNKQEESNSNATVLQHGDESPVTGYSPLPYSIHAHEAHHHHHQHTESEHESHDDMDGFDINEHLSNEEQQGLQDEYTLKQLLREQMDDPSGSEPSFQMQCQSDTEERAEDDEVVIDQQNTLTAPASFVLETPTATMPMPIPSDFVPGIPNLSNTNTMTLTPQYHAALNAIADDERLPAVAETNSALYDSRNDTDNDNGMRIANIQQTNVDIQYQPVAQNNCSTSRSKSASPITPQPINTGLVKQAPAVHLDDNADPPTPETPPTPESPQSGSGESGSRFEREMRKIDVQLANFEHHKSESAQAGAGNPAEQQMKISDNSKDHRIPTRSDNTAIAHNDVRPTTGCTCVVL